MAAITTVEKGVGGPASVAAPLSPSPSSSSSAAGAGVTVGLIDVDKVVVGAGVGDEVGAGVGGGSGYAPGARCSTRERQRHRDPSATAQATVSVSLPPSKAGVSVDMVTDLTAPVMLDVRKKDANGAAAEPQVRVRLAVPSFSSTTSTIVWYSPGMSERRMYDSQSPPSAAQAEEPPAKTRRVELTSGSALDVMHSMDAPSTRVRFSCCPPDSVDSAK
mmetsp:Transcript_14586/g.45817  ORF Transcript_14586/g.45817 Transcript_14586/m.45817 type:complete len:218 (+) Transcript_14586:461-1114(+)